MSQKSNLTLAAALAACALAMILGGTAAPSAGQTRAEPSVRVDAPEALQASCGDGRCSPPEDCHSCPGDCGDCCGNGRCEPPEDCRSCPGDCGSCCGNHRCEPPEDERSCPSDCQR